MNLVLIAAAVAALTLDPALEPSEEARARALDAEIRCLVCQNEPIAQSTAEVASDMRALVRERIAAGDSDAEIRTFFRERYGDFVLLRPPVDPRTFALWAAPLLLIGLGAAALWINRRRDGSAPFEPEEGER